MFAWMWRGYGNLDEVSIWLVLRFLGPAQVLAELVHHNEKNQLQPNTPHATVWTTLQTSSFFDCVASYLFHMAFSLAVMCFNINFTRDNSHDNHTIFFSVLADCLIWKCKCNTPISPLNLLLLLLEIICGNPYNSKLMQTLISCNIHHHYFLMLMVIFWT